MQKPPTYALGLDYGTSSVRALLVDTRTGQEVGNGSCSYAHGEHGVLLDAHDPHHARQHPADYPIATARAVREALHAASAVAEFRSERIVGIGVDTTGSTPLPVDPQARPLAFLPEFASEPAAMAWLWKDHTAYREAQEISERVRALGLPYLDPCGGSYSSEWYWSKVLHCQRTAPEVAAAAAGWLELCDYIPAWLCGIETLAAVPRSRCAAGHKGMYHPRWQGLPPADFLTALHPGLARVRATFRSPALTSDQRAGTLAPQVAAALGLPAGLPVAVGALDAHLGALGSGCAPGTLVKILGTSTCDCLVAPLSLEVPSIPGIAGVVPESIVPGMHGFEAGQSAVGDIFQWFAQRFGPAATAEASQQQWTAAAAELAPGASGLLALDWHNGNRCVLMDARLSGLVLGLSLATAPAELYRALLEATAFGARMILDRFAAHGIAVERIVAAGGIAAKNPLLLQIYADVCERPILLARSAAASALGAALCGAVVGGAHADLPRAQWAMTGLQETVYAPQPAAVQVYRELYGHYQTLHDAFGLPGAKDLSTVMKDLLRIADRARAPGKPARGHENG